MKMIFLNIQLFKYKVRFNDDSAKLYSKNSNFKVYALWEYMSNFFKVELNLDSLKINQE